MGELAQCIRLPFHEQGALGRLGLRNGGGFQWCPLDFFPPIRFFDGEAGKIFTVPAPTTANRMLAGIPCFLLGITKCRANPILSVTPIRRAVHTVTLWQWLKHALKNSRKRLPIKVAHVVEWQTRQT